MKRSLILFMILGLIVGSVTTAEAGRARPKRVERTVEGTYATQFLPGNSWCTPYNGLEPPHGLGCVAVETRKGEAYLTGKVEDAHGQPVLVSLVTEDPDGNSGQWIYHGSFCGETAEPIEFFRGVDVYLVVGYGGPNLTDPAPSLADCDPMLGTTGTVSVTLSNLP